MFNLYSIVVKKTYELLRNIWSIHLINSCTNYWISLCLKSAKIARKLMKANSRNSFVDFIHLNIWEESYEGAQGKTFLVSATFQLDLRPFPFDVPWSYQKCIAKCLYSYWDSLLQNSLGITTAQDAICSLSFPIVLYAKHHLSRTQDTNQTARHSLQNNGNVIISTCLLFLFFFSLEFFSIFTKFTMWCRAG